MQILVYTLALVLYISGGLCLRFQSIFHYKKLNITQDENAPEGYQTVIPYLILSGAKRFLEFAKKVFNATENHTVMATEDLIRHAQVKIGDSTIMFADSTEQFPPNPAGMFVYVKNADETYQKALDEGATSIMPPSDQQYGRSCGVTDPLGNTWWITSIISNPK
jgi:uncharacterized glyoxalase superfamily protein PhnB